jgi:hypothetical protein
LKAKRSRKDVHRTRKSDNGESQPEDSLHEGSANVIKTPGPADPGVSDVVSTAVPSEPVKGNNKCARRVRSNTVLATITTVIKMEEGGRGHHGRRASIDSRLKHGEAKSRVSLVPEIGEMDLSVISGEDEEFMSAGEASTEHMDTIDGSESSREDTIRGKERGTVLGAARVHI